jgi:hypothetical protein
MDGVKHQNDSCLSFGPRLQRCSAKSKKGPESPPRVSDEVNAIKNISQALSFRLTNLFREMGKMAVGKQRNLLFLFAMLYCLREI